MRTRSNKAGIRIPSNEFANPISVNRALDGMSGIAYTCKEMYSSAQLTKGILGMNSEKLRRG